MSISHRSFSVTFFAITVLAACLALASSANATDVPNDDFSIQAPDGSVPNSWITVDVVSYAGKDARHNAIGGVSAINHSGSDQDYGTNYQTSAIGFTISVTPPNEEVIEMLGHANVSGRAEVDIYNGEGFGSAAATATASITYGSQCVEAQDEAALAITTIGTTQTIGANVTIAGYGGGFTTTWQSDLNHSRVVPLSDGKSGQWEETCNASGTFHTVGGGTLWLENGAEGYTTGYATAGGLLLIRVKP
jgi:hypothetical protein